MRARKRAVARFVSRVSFTSAGSPPSLCSASEYCASAWLGVALGLGLVLGLGLGRVRVRGGVGGMGLGDWGWGWVGVSLNWLHLCKVARTEGLITHALESLELLDLVAHLARARVVGIELECLAEVLEGVLELADAVERLLRGEG